MAGGGSQGGSQNPASSQQLSQMLQQYPQMNNPSGGANPGGAMATAAPNPQMQAPPTGMQALLANMQAQTPQQKAAMNLMGQGMGMAQMGSQQRPMSGAPMQRSPVMQGGPPVPQTAGQAAQQLTPNAMSQYLFRGLMGGGQ